MAYSAAKKSFKTTLTLGGVAVAQLYSITGPTITTDVLDDSQHDQGDNWRRYISTLSDAGEIEFEGATSGAGITQISAVFNVDTTTWVISLEFGTTDITMTFTGILTEYTPSGDMPVDGKHQFKAKVKITGPIVFAGLS